MYLRLSFSLSEFVEQTYAKQGAKIEKKILSQHKNRHKGVSEGDAKSAYIKLAKGLATFGTTFFLVKVWKTCKLSFACKVNKGIS